MGSLGKGFFSFFLAGQMLWRTSLGAVLLNESSSWAESESKAEPEKKGKPEDGALVELRDRRSIKRVKTEASPSSNAKQSKSSFSSAPSIADSKNQMSNERSSQYMEFSPGKGWESISPSGFSTVWVEAEPWWRRKEKAKMKLQEENRVLVSVVSEVSSEKTSPLHQMRMSGVGWVKAPAAFVSARLREFYRLKDLSDYILESTYTPSQKRLYLHIEAFNYHAHMWMDILLQNGSKEKYQIFFHVVDGTLQGMKGVVQVVELKPDRSELSLTAFYAYDQFPIPKFFLEFGLEIVLKKVAEAMRSMMEELYLAGKSKSGQ